MVILKFSEVISCLERTDPTHPPSFYYALEVVKRYARAKIAKGRGRQLMCKHGKLETLESKFSSLGLQDIFYLTRLHLKLPPSSITLTSPSTTVRQTLLKAGYPLPASSPQAGPSSPKNRLDGRARGRRGSRSLTSLTSSPVPFASTTSALRRSSSSRPDIPSTSSSNIKDHPHGHAGNVRSKITGAGASASAKASSSPSNSSSCSSHSPTMSSRWTPLLMGLGLKTILDSPSPSSKTAHQAQTPSISQQAEITFNNFDPFHSPASLTSKEHEKGNMNPQSPSSVEFLDLTSLDLNDNHQDGREIKHVGMILNETNYNEAYSLSILSPLPQKEGREVEYLESTLDLEAGDIQLKM
ncbi:hypothetical protein V865_007714 [Kwoniella europaea PYCC6329]|uniref:Uncharacterized protein n=1 Tax=Kwoniella europaea PYCC6329 TaxID=1423913 RepID=A0AAX4KSY6_9TREE